MSQREEFEKIYPVTSPIIVFSDNNYFIDEGSCTEDDIQELKLCRARWNAWQAAQKPKIGEYPYAKSDDYQIHAKRIAGLEAQLNVATKLLDERKDEIGVLNKDLESENKWASVYLAKAQELESDNEKFLKLLSEMDKYLSSYRDSSIGNGCIFHREIYAALKASKGSTE